MFFLNPNFSIDGIKHVGTSKNILFVPRHISISSSQLCVQIVLRNHSVIVVKETKEEKLKKTQQRRSPKPFSCYPITNVCCWTLACFYRGQVVSLAPRFEMVLFILFLLLLLFQKLEEMQIQQLNVKRCYIMIKMKLSTVQTLLMFVEVNLSKTQYKTKHSAI